MNILITGGSRGIGAAAVELFAQKGHRVFFLYEKNHEAAKLVQNKTGAEAICCDVADRDAVQKALANLPAMDVLINNAGCAANAPFEEVTPAEFDRIMNINVRVPFLLTQLALPYLKRSETATIINIASVTGHSGYPQQSVYSASKHALLGLTKSIAAEYYKENIRVHAISPGGVYTDMVKITRPDLSSEGMIMPEDIAEIVHFFLLLIFCLFGQSLFNGRSDFVCKLTDDRSFRGSNLAHTAKDGCEFALFAEILDAKLFCIFRSFDFSNCFDANLFKQFFHKTYFLSRIVIINGM